MLEEDFQRSKTGFDVNTKGSWQGGYDYEGPLNSFYRGLCQTDVNITQHNITQHA